MITATEALQSTVEAEIALLYTHIATKDACIATVSAAPGQSIDSATNSWLQQLAFIQNRLDTAINKLRDAISV